MCDAHDFDLISKFMRIRGLYSNSQISLRKCLQLFQLEIKLITPHQQFEHTLVTHNNDDLARLSRSLAWDSRHSSSYFLRIFYNKSRTHHKKSTFLLFLRIQTNNQFYLIFPIHLNYYIDPSA